MGENKELGSFSVDVEIMPNGNFDVYISRDGDSGCHYTDVTAEQVGKLLADDITFYADMAE